MITYITIDTLLLTIYIHKIVNVPHLFPLMSPNYCSQRDNVAYYYFLYA